MIHKDLEFQVDNSYVTQDIGEALHSAFARAVHSPVNFDVLCYSADAAEEWETDGSKSYNNDPEASVFRRYRITVEDLGQIP